VIAEVRQIESRLSAGSGPVFGVLVRSIPIAGVSQLVSSAEALHIFHQRTGVIQLRARFQILPDARKRIVRAVLVSGAPIIDVKNLAAHLLGWMRSSRALRLNRIPGIFVMIGAGAFFRPVDWLMQMPEPGGVDAGVILGASSRKNKRRHQCKGTAKNGGGYNGARFATNPEYSPLSKPPNIWRAPRRELANPFGVARKIWDTTRSTGSGQATRVPASSPQDVPSYFSSSNFAFTAASISWYNFGSDFKASFAASLPCASCVPL
jgi:hypothetical protein